MVEHCSTPGIQNLGLPIVLKIWSLWFMMESLSNVDKLYFKREDAHEAKEKISDQEHGVAITSALITQLFVILHSILIDCRVANYEC